MSSPPELPPEILDLIVDHLRIESFTLKTSCLVSKSWIPRTRRHIFATVWLDSLSIERWKKFFPDPSTSPAHHTRVLKLFGFPDLSVVETSTIACIRSFRHLEELKVATLGWDDRQVSLAPFRGLSPTLKSLVLRYESLPTSEVLNLICSFPHLEDLTLSDFDGVNDTDARDIPSPSPKLTGTLKLNGSRLSIARGLLNLGCGLHFSKIVMTWPVGDAGSAMELVSKCSDNLESLSMSYSHWGTVKEIIPPAFDLSRYPKLRDIEFHAGSVSIRWILTTLQGTKPMTLQRIMIIVYCFTPDERGERAQEWRDLDRLLSRLWTSHSILPKVTCNGCMGTFAQRLLPELSSRGGVREVVDHPWEPRLY